MLVSPPPIALRVQLLKHTKCDIMRSLCVLPKTQHDLNSFMVDVWFQTVSTGFLPRAAPESHGWVGSLGDLAPGPFPFRRRCSASLSTGCSRKVRVCRTSSPDAPLLSPCWLGSLSELSQLPWCLPFSSYARYVLPFPRSPQIILV